MTETSSARDRGVSLLKAGDQEGAIREFRAAIAENPEDGKAHGFLGMLQARSGDTVAGIESLRRSTELQPDDAAAHFNLGLVLCEAHRRQEAIEELHKALSINPSHAKALQLRRCLEAEPSNEPLPGGAAEPVLSVMPHVPAPADTTVIPKPFGASVDSPPPSPAAIPMNTTLLGTPSGAPLDATLTPGSAGPGAAMAMPQFNPSSLEPSEPTLMMSAPGAEQAEEPATFGLAFGQAPPPPPAPGPTLHQAAPKLAKYELPDTRTRVWRGVAWGAAYGQLWVLCSALGLAMACSAMSFFALLLAVVIVAASCAVIGIFMGLVIAVFNLDPDSAATFGVVIGILGWILQLVGAGFTIFGFSIVAFFYLGRIIGSGIATKCQEQLMLEQPPL